MLANVIEAYLNAATSHYIEADLPFTDGWCVSADITVVEYMVIDGLGDITTQRPS